MNAIGMIEVFSLVNAITIADECLKTANVNLIGIENVSSGIVTVKITGDVGAVTSSVNSVKNLEKVVYHSVIPSIDEQALNILKNSKRNVFKSTKKENNSKLNTEQKDLQIKENEKNTEMEANNTMGNLETLEKNMMKEESGLSNP
ncbi:MAG: BMC domain-containing protein, partial [Eubacteriales bacterium]|nr:BMC domain-containing protein [Eubacteriales bacterium]